MSGPPSHASYTEHGVHHEQRRPSFTDGPAEFVIANDGSKDCVALLIPQIFLDKLNDFFQQDEDLYRTKGPVIHAKMDIENTEHSLRRAQQALAVTESEKEKEEIHKYLDHQKPRLLKLCQRRDLLEEQCTTLKREASRSSNYAHYVLKTAMESAHLLRKAEPIHIPEIDSEESIHFPSRERTTPQTRPQPTPSPEELERQEAYEELKDCWHHLDKIQCRFDERESLYKEEVARWQKGYPNGAYHFPRSELDRQHVKYGMRLTGALIDAESAFEKAKDRADALGLGSERSESEDDHRYDSREQVQISASMLDRRAIESWRAKVEGFEIYEDLDAVMTMEDFDADAGFVEMSDSLSARTGGERRKKIDRWQKACRVLERPDRQRFEKMWIDDDQVVGPRHSA